MPINATTNIPVKRESMLYHVSMAMLFLASRLWPGIMLHYHFKPIRIYRHALTDYTMWCYRSHALHAINSLISFVFSLLFSPINALLSHPVCLRFHFIISLLFSSKCNCYSICSIHKYSILFYSMSTVFA